MNNQGRNEHVYNIGENNNQHEAIRYISYGVEEPMHSFLTSNMVNTRNANEIFSITNNHLRFNDVSLSEAYGMRRIDVPYAHTHMRSFTGLTNNTPSMNLNFTLGRNEPVYNISENNNQHEAIRYISDELEQPMHSSFTSSLANTRSVNEIFSITPSRMYDDDFLSEIYGMRRIDVPYMAAAQSHMRSTPNNNASMNLNFLLGRNEQVYNTSENNFNITNSHSIMNDDVSLSEVYGMRRIDVPSMPANQTHMRSVTSLTNHSADINLNLSLGRNEEVHNTSENNNQNEAIRYIPDGVEPIMHPSLTSSLVNPRSVNEISNIGNCPPRMNDDVSRSEVYGMRRTDDPYMPVATSPTNSSASINLNLSLGLSSSSPTRVESPSRRTSFTIPYEEVPLNLPYEEVPLNIPYQEIPLNLPLKRRLTQRELGESSSRYFPYASPQRELEESGSRYFPYAPPSQRELGESGSRYFPYAPSQRELGESGSSYFPYASSQRELGESSARYFPYAPSARSSIYEHGESSSSHFPYAPFARSSIFEHGESSASHFPYAPFAGSSIYEHGESSSSHFASIFEHGESSSSHFASILENQRRLGSTSSAIEIVRNDGQRPYIRLRQDPELMSQLRDDPEIMRAMLREMLLRIEERRIQERNERGLTEDEIMKYISCGYCEVANEEGTSENKEMCCICQEAFANGDELGKLDCEHIFHLNCIKEWLSEKNVCPLCKRRGLFVGDH